MHQDNFGRLFLVALAFVSFQLAVCVPVGSVNRERIQEKKLANDSPFSPQLAKIHGENPATYLEDPGLGNTAPERKMFLKRKFGGGFGGGLVEPDDKRPVQPETRVVQKRIFYDNQGRDYNPDTYIPEKTGSEMLQTRRMYGSPLPVEASDDSRKLEDLLALRDRARAVHEKINYSIERFREGTRMAAKMREPDDKEMRQLEHILPDMG